MRIYAKAQTNKLRTVKSQGEYVAEVWGNQRGFHRPTVKAIKRVGHADNLHWGFLVLETYCNSYLCHYLFNHDRLEVTEEISLSADHRDYLQCPESLLAMTEVQNSRWRDLNRTYLKAAKALTGELKNKDVRLFLKKGYSTREYSEPFFVVAKESGYWYGYDCYNEKKYLRVDNGEILDHCPVVFDEAGLKAIETDGLADDCVVAGGLVYKQDRDYACLLGRKQTTDERVTSALQIALVPVRCLEPALPWFTH